MEVTTIGIDLAKSVFQICGMNRAGKVVLTRKLKRADFSNFMAQQKNALVGMEACSSAHFWARELAKMGHECRLIPAQYVKPFVKTNKNDFNDAEAIAEAVQRPSMHFVPVKTAEQLNVQALHRIRERVVAERTALINEMRGLLSEHGVVMSVGSFKFRREIVEFLETKAAASISKFFQKLIRELYRELDAHDARVDFYDDQIKRIFEQNEVCQRIAKIEGVGPLISTAMVAAVGDAKAFKSGRQMSAWLGLVPKQHSSGGKTVLLGISKRGNPYLRTLLIHGARSAVLRSKDKGDRRHQWINEKLKSRGPNKTYVAVANKNVRIIWKLMTSGERYEVRAA